MLKPLKSAGFRLARAEIDRESTFKLVEPKSIPLKASVLSFDTFVLANKVADLVSPSAASWAPLSAATADSLSAPTTAALASSLNCWALTPLAKFAPNEAAFVSVMAAIPAVLKPAQPDWETAPSCVAVRLS